MARNKTEMNEKQILSAFMRVHGETIKSVADKAGENNQTLSNKLRRTDSTLSLTTVYALMKAMGVEIVFRDASGMECVLTEGNEEIDISGMLERAEEERQAAVAEKKAENAAAMLKNLK